MKLEATAGWRVRDGARVRPVDGRLLALLRAVERSGALTGAARSCGIPYRTAWGLLAAAGRELGAPLVTLERGRGAALAPLAQRWLALDDQARGVIEAARLALAVRPASERAGAKALPRLGIAASHDIALAMLRDGWRARHGIALEFHGSAESLDAYRAGEVDLAGFHVMAAPSGYAGQAAPAASARPPTAALRAALAERAASSARTVRGNRATRSDPLRSRLDPARDAVVRFITREQGLILPRGNPRRVRSLTDVAAKRLSMINRQPGSGTRLLLDRLLASANVEPARLAGYSNEEFTHAAVAATVAAGKADVAVGIRAAAAQFGLAFVPLATERYLFACRRRALASPAVAAFRALLASRETRGVVASLPGYVLDAPGEPMAVEMLGT